MSNYHLTQEQARKIAMEQGFVVSRVDSPLMLEMLHAYANAVLDKVLGEQWQPIDTIPINESVLMLRMGMYGRCGMSDGYRQENGVVVWAYIKEPTHWMPLPSAPKESALGSLEQQPDGSVHFEEYKP